MLLPEELIITLSVIGIFTASASLLWAAPQLWYRIKYSRFRPTYEEIELKHLRQMQELKTRHLSTRLEAEQAHNRTLSDQLQDTIDKLVKRI